MGPISVTLPNFIKIGQTVKRLLKYGDLTVFNFFRVGAVKNPFLHHGIKFRKGRSNHWGEISRFLWFLKWRPSAILDLLGAHWDHPRRPLRVFIVMQNLVEIDAAVSIIWHSQYFASLAWKRPFTPPKLSLLGEFHRQNEEQYQRILQKAHPCASQRRLSH